MNEIDKYLIELSEIYGYDNSSKVLIEDVINRLLEMRNSLPKSKTSELVIDGDELSRYFRGKNKNRNNSSSE